MSKHWSRRAWPIFVRLIFILLVPVAIGACQPAASVSSGAVGGDFPSTATPQRPGASPTARRGPTSTPEPTDTPEPARFSGERAYEFVLRQMEFGPRLPGSEAHAATRELIKTELEAAGWTFEEQQTEYQGQTVINLVGKSTAQLDSDKPWIIVGAHYDSRLQANMDPDLDKIDDPVPGANDGASGVGVLLELAHTLPVELPNNIWLVFFDAEDNGNINGWDWIMGSNAFVAGLQSKPDAAVIIDMIGDTDLNIYYEQNSDDRLLKQIWEQAAELGFEAAFIPEYRHRILDDHIPFLQAGIPAVDLIDFDYPYWHTTADTADKVSPKSLYIVGETLWHWLQVSLSLAAENGSGG